MAFVCIENGKVSSIAEYKPAVPNTVEVVEIPDQDYFLIVGKSHEFNITTKKVEEVSAVDRSVELAASSNIRFLKETDWMVLRHLRELQLGVATSLTPEMYLRLEEKRQLAAKSI